VALTDRPEAVGTFEDVTQALDRPLVVALWTQAACNTRSMEPRDVEVCMRCGRPAEAGSVYASPVGLTGGGTIGWMPPDAGVVRQLLSRGEPLIDSLVGPVSAPAMRCPVCRLVWFEYPGDESPRLHEP
jgi:hypothetical protein